MKTLACIVWVAFLGLSKFSYYCLASTVYEQNYLTQPRDQGVTNKFYLSNLVERALQLELQKSLPSLFTLAQKNGLDISLIIMPHLTQAILNDKHPWALAILNRLRECGSPIDIVIERLLNVGYQFGNEKLIISAADFSRCFHIDMKNTIIHLYQRARYHRCTELADLLENLALESDLTMEDLEISDSSVFSRI